MKASEALQITFHVARLIVTCPISCVGARARRRVIEDTRRNLHRFGSTITWSEVTSAPLGGVVVLNLGIERATGIQLWLLHGSAEETRELTDREICDLWMSETSSAIFEAPWFASIPCVLRRLLPNHRIVEVRAHFT